MTIKLGWGWRIGLLYTAFAAMILALVTASSRQKFDLVSKEYYKDEIAYQHILDASNNQAKLAGTLAVHASGTSVSIDFPAEFSGQEVKGTVTFYSAIDKSWDRSIPVKLVNNAMTINRDGLVKTNYKVKTTYVVNGKSYYQEDDLNLSK